ncbi:hypothetical protein FGO68_gene11013 [Halteria grandinella]|uniref:Uncharacterized protein n=1 Tax=Halteria grandinella TaxID=5974 RepID=A0A8J8P5E0_HALGN|nr:hypothetical protein FGO68_gene11013 [Halteria grandinella]
MRRGLLRIQGDTIKDCGTFKETICFNTSCLISAYTTNINHHTFLMKWPTLGKRQGSTTQNLSHPYKSKRQIKGQ